MTTFFLSSPEPAARVLNGPDRGAAQCATMVGARQVWRSSSLKGAPPEKPYHTGPRARLLRHCRFPRQSRSVAQGWSVLMGLGKRSRVLTTPAGRVLSGSEASSPRMAAICGTRFEAFYGYSARSAPSCVKNQGPHHRQPLRKVRAG